MLVLTRKRKERIVITVGGETVVLSVEELRGDKVRLGFLAPLHVQINREEVQNRKDRRDAESQTIKPTPAVAAPAEIP